MKIRLLNCRSNSYQLCSGFEKIDFNIEDVSFLKIQKKHCFLSFTYFLVYSTGICLISINYYSLPYILLAVFLILSMLIFITIIYKRIYTIDITIHNERFSIETKDKLLIHDFLLLQFFYREINVNNFQLIKDGN